jgi:NADH-quinone oxidoreductase subunit G
MIQLIGTNPRLEAPVLNARIRKAWTRGATVGLVGEPVDLTYDYVHVGTDRAALQSLVDKQIGEAKEMDTIIILGANALIGEDGAAVLAATQKLVENTKSKFLVVHNAASRVGGLDLGFTTDGGVKKALGAEVIFNLGADEIDIPEGPFVVYQGSHGDRGAHRADVILPAACYTEEAGIFVNTEGRPQLARRANFPPGAAKENWAIIRALSAELGKQLPFDSLPELHAALFKAHPHLGRIDEVPENEWKALPMGNLGKGAFANPVKGHYQTNPILRASTVMAELTRLADDRNRAIAAE